jgi:hypothetical protein
MTKGNSRRQTATVEMDVSAQGKKVLGCMGT